MYFCEYKEKGAPKIGNTKQRIREGLSQKKWEGKTAKHKRRITGNRNEQRYDYRRLENGETWGLKRVQGKEQNQQKGPTFFDDFAGEIHSSIYFFMQQDQLFIFAGIVEIQRKQ